MKAMRVAAGALMAAVLGTAMLGAAPARAELVCGPRVVDQAIQDQKPKTVQVCLDPAHVPPGVTEASFVVHAKYDAKGQVISDSIQTTSPQGDTMGMASCLASRVRTWTFPCGPNEVDVPFAYKAPAKR